MNWFDAELLMILFVELKCLKWNVFPKAIGSGWGIGSGEWHQVSSFHYDINILYNAVHFSLDAL